MRYIDIIEQGFAREDYEDTVYFNQYGVQPFHLSKELTKRYTAYWMQETGNIELLKCDRKGNVLKRVDIDSLDKFLLVEEVLVTHNN